MNRNILLIHKALESQQK